MTDGEAAEALLECDLVMKGGVTSGIVYPAAIAAIARQYRLKSIGGTSAGAIGAAAAAAMEFGRLSNRNAAALEQLEGMAAKLGVQVDNRPLLFRLFEPDQGTARLFRLLLQLSELRKTGFAVRALLRQPLCLAAILVGLICAALLWFSPVPLPWPSAASLFLVLVLGVPSLTLAFLWLKWSRVLRDGLSAMVANGFGFCSGMARYSGSGGARAPSLMAWLHEQYQSLAGLPANEPLTFGDLWAAADRADGLSRDEALTATKCARGQEGKSGRLDLIARDIDLALVASDINRAQSVQLPFMRREDRLYARLSDLRAMFPQEVVDWMSLKQRRVAADELAGADLGDLSTDDLIRLPDPADLPLLFAVRMSLSFPFLFRAVRLYVLRRRGDAQMGKDELAELWLADGGITSNFPIHLFDAPIPTRPTFCLNLLYHDDELEPDHPRRTIAPGATDDQGEAREEGEGLPTVNLPSEIASIDSLVYMLRTNHGRLSAYTRFTKTSPLQALGRFGSRIVTTARQWGDNQLIDVPGYRDRIVHIRMLPDEGGFNFDMSVETIDRLGQRGARAGAIIASRFDPKTITDPFHPGERLKLNWANHRHIRFRSFLASLELAAKRFTAAWRSDLAGAGPSLDQVAKRVRPSSNPFAAYVGYPFRSKAQGDLALRIVKAVKTLDGLSPDARKDGVDFWKGRSGSPRPKGGLKLRPAPETDVLDEMP